MRTLVGRVGRGLTAVAVLTLCLTGCSDRDETHHPLFQKGVRARSDGDGAAAAECFENLLLRRPRAVRAHLELAGVYDELLDEPLLAAVHYRVYLERFPDHPDAAAIRAWQQAAERRFCEKWLKMQRPEKESAETGTESLPEAGKTASGSSAEPSGGGTSGADISGAESPVPTTAKAGEPVPGEAVLTELREENRVLREYLAECKKQIALLNGEVRRLNAASGASAVSPAPGGGGSEYTVQPGDTPGGIARKVYGSHRLYSEIMRANPGVNERSLRPGMVLRIPPLSAAQGGKND